LTDARLTKDNRGNQGHRLPNVPTHAGSLWLKFDALPERFETGFGVYIAGQREGDLANSFQLPGYARVDAFAAYHWKIESSRLTAQININNLFDKTYFYGGEPSFAFPRVNILPAEPITVLGSLRLEI
jgi:iron complex outermembrane receptor protein